MEHIKIKKARKSLIYTLLEVFGKPACGGSGIRTRGTGLPVRRFSKPVVSATHPPIRGVFY